MSDPISLEAARKKRRGVQPEFTSPLPAAPKLARKDKETAKYFAAAETYAMERILRYGRLLNKALATKERTPATVKRVLKYGRLSMNAWCDLAALMSRIK